MTRNREVPSLYHSKTLKLNHKEEGKTFKKKKKKRRYIKKYAKNSTKKLTKMYIFKLHKTNDIHHK